MGQTQAVAVTHQFIKRWVTLKELTHPITAPTRPLQPSLLDELALNYRLAMCPLPTNRSFISIPLFPIS